MKRTRTTIYLGPQTRAWLERQEAGDRSMSGEIEWAVAAFLAAVEESLPTFRLTEWVVVTASLEALTALAPAQARFVGDELVRAHKRGEGKGTGVDLSGLGYRLGAAPFPVQLAVMHVARACAGSTTPSEREARLVALLPTKAIAM